MRLFPETILHAVSSLLAFGLLHESLPSAIPVPRLDAFGRDGADVGRQQGISIAGTPGGEGGMARGAQEIRRDGFRGSRKEASSLWSLGASGIRLAVPVKSLQLPPNRQTCAARLAFSWDGRPRPSSPRTATIMSPRALSRIKLLRASTCPLFRSKVRFNQPRSPLSQLSRVLLAIRRRAAGRRILDADSFLEAIREPVAANQHIRQSPLNVDAALPPRCGCREWRCIGSELRRTARDRPRGCPPRGRLRQSDIGRWTPAAPPSPTTSCSTTERTM